MSAKIPAIVDAPGDPTGFSLAGGRVHGLAGADPLLPGMDANTLIADKRVVEPLAAAGKESVIPPKANRKVARDHDCDLCKARHLVENLFAKLKQFRATATRHDKTARNFLGGAHLAATLAWLHRRHAINHTTSNELL